ncbi:periplasmic murein peptide-binding protein precursor [Xenorhabdus indica]|nr:periplasmic murein peptide-binding protein precursor [Xenorhabdus indica]
MLLFVPQGIKLAAKQEIVRNNLVEPASLDTHKVSSNVEFDIIHDFFDGLVYTDRQGNIELRLAESWEADDNKTWVFHLRKGIKWSDSTPITAQDFVFSWRCLVEPDIGSLYGSDLIIKDSPVIPTYYYVSARMVKPYAGGFYVNSLGYISTKDLYVIDN